MPLPEAQLRIGRLFESEFERQAHRRGLFVVRHCDQLGVHGTKAPMTHGPFAGYRLPDFTVMKAGASYWAEVKLKSRPTYTHRLQQYDHGVDLPNWTDYLAVEKVSGLPGFLIVGERSTGCILAASFAHLKAVARIVTHKTSSFPHGGVFWPRDSFRRWGDFVFQTGQMAFAFDFCSEVEGNVHAT